MKKEICESCVNSKKALGGDARMACFCTHYNCPIAKSDEDTCEYYKARTSIKKKMQNAKPSKMFDDLSEEDKIDAITNGKCKSKLLRIKEEISNMDFKDKIETDQNFINDMKECARNMAIVEGGKDIEQAGDNLFKHEAPVYVPLNEIIEVIDKYINEAEG